MSEGLVLVNGRAPLNKKGDYITRGQAEQMVTDAVNAAVQRERAENEQMVKWYMMQIPELVAKMLGDALAANGLEMKGPQEASNPAGHAAAQDDTAFRAQHADETLPTADEGGSGGVV